MALATTTGDIALAFTKLRQGAFLPSLLERRRRIVHAVFAVVMEAYVTGTSAKGSASLVRRLA
jgi:putative transposase